MISLDASVSSDTTDRMMTLRPSRGAGDDEGLSGTRGNYRAKLNSL